MNSFRHCITTQSNYRPCRLVLNIQLLQLFQPVSGPIGAGKSSLIDFLCNYFYENRFDSDFRYKIADEVVFDFPRTHRGV